MMKYLHRYYLLLELLMQLAAIRYILGREQFENFLLFRKK